jgi:hypothetical protein
MILVQVGSAPGASRHGAHQPSPAPISLFASARWLTPGG